MPLVATGLFTWFFMGQNRHTNLPTPKVELPATKIFKERLVSPPLPPRFALTGLFH
jgi:hypothetical protein